MPPILPKPPAVGEAGGGGEEASGCPPSPALPKSSGLVPPPGTCKCPTRERGEGAASPSPNKPGTHFAIDHLGRQHQAGQLLNLCGRRAWGLGQSLRQGRPGSSPGVEAQRPESPLIATRGPSESKRCFGTHFEESFLFVCLHLLLFLVSPRILKASTTSPALHPGKV